MSMHKGLIGKSEGGGSVDDKTLADYLRRKNRDEAFNVVNAEKKLTFEEWWYGPGNWLGNYVEESQAFLIWKAAQENK